MNGGGREKTPRDPLALTLMRAPYVWQAGGIIGGRLPPRYHGGTNA